MCSQLGPLLRLKFTPGDALDLLHQVGVRLRGEREHLLVAQRERVLRLVLDDPEDDLVQGRLRVAVPPGVGYQRHRDVRRLLGDLVRTAGPVGGFFRNASNAAAGRPAGFRSPAFAATWAGYRNGNRLFQSGYGLLNVTVTVLSSSEPVPR